MLKRLIWIIPFFLVVSTLQSQEKDSVMLRPLADSILNDKSLKMPESAMPDSLFPNFGFDFGDACEYHFAYKDSTDKNLVGYVDECIKYNNLTRVVRFRFFFFRESNPRWVLFFLAQVKSMAGGASECVVWFDEGFYSNENGELSGNFREPIKESFCGEKMQFLQERISVYLKNH